jgi:glycerophosphoryl diester phosphodiesterase
VSVILPAGAIIWSPFYRDVDRARIDEAHALGLKVVVWTVNEPAQIERMLDLGVDCLISDRPDIVRKILRSR